MRIQEAQKHTDQECLETLFWKEPESLTLQYNMVYFGIVWFNQPLEERGKKFEEKFRFFSLSPKSQNSSPFARWLCIRGNSFSLRALKTNLVGKGFYFGPI
jgi:hypothetical protein